MPTIVELPDKTELEFPDGMDEMAMRGAISKHFPQFAKPFPSERATLPAPGQTIATHAALDTQPPQAFPVTPAQPPERRPAITTTMQDALMSGVRQEPPPPEAEIEPIGQPGTILHGATSVAAGILNRPEYLAAMMNPATAAAVGARFLPGVAKQFFEDLGKATQGDNEALGRAAAIGIPALIGGVRTGRTVTERLNAQSALERARSASSQSHIDALSRLESTPTAAQQQPTILKRSDAELAKIPESEEEHAISQRETEKVPVEVPPGDRGTVGAQVREQAAPQEARPDDAAAKEAAAQLPRNREEELLRQPAAESEAKQPAAPEPEPTPAGPVEPAGAIPKNVLDELSRTASRYDEYARPYEGGTGLAAGNEGIEHRWKSDAIREFRDALQSGKTVDEAEAIAKEKAREWISRNNKRRPKDISWQRWEGSADSAIEDAKSLVIKGKTTVPEPSPAPAQAAKGEAPVDPRLLSDEQISSELQSISSVTDPLYAKLEAMPEGGYTGPKGGPTPEAQAILDQIKPLASRCVVDKPALLQLVCPAPRH